MFTKIFKKRGISKGESSENLPSAPTTADLTDVVLDNALLALDSALCGLAEIEVAQAAKERGWATVSRELERHPVRQVAAVPAKGVATRPVLTSTVARTVPAGHSRGWRVAIGSMAAVVAVTIAVLGSYGAGLFSTTAGTTVTTVVQGTLPPTSVADSVPPATGDSTTISTPGSTSTAPDVTTTATTGRTTTTNGGQGTTSTSRGPSVTNNAPTTQPQQNTTTTNEQQMADAELEKSATSVAQALGRAVLDKFSSGELSGVRSLVDPNAQSALTWMISSLDDPSGFSVDQSATKTLTDDTVRVTLQFIDGDKSPRFFIKVRVTPSSASVIDISRGL